MSYGSTAVLVPTRTAEHPLTTGSDLQFTPKNGTPPYTLVIAPAYHPPVNITGNSTAPLNYTIRMTHGQAFFASMYDKAGSSWAMGPFHAGTNKNVSCLQVLTGQSYVGGAMPGVASSSGGGVGVAALGGGIAGAFVAGAVLAGLAVFLLARKKKSVSDHHYLSTLPSPSLILHYVSLPHAILVHCSPPLDRPPLIIPEREAK
jgi:hypothetical protein